MFREGLSENKDVVDVDAYGAVHNEVLENVIHHGLGGRGTVSEAEKHHEGFEQSMVCAECGFPLVPFFYSNIVVTPPNVKLGEIPGPAELIKSTRK